MDKKRLIRRKYLFKRKKNFFEIKNTFFEPLKNLIKKTNGKDIKNISLYFPSNFEVNVLKILDIQYFKKFKFSLPIISKNHVMNFYLWKNKDILLINKYGIPEPQKTLKIEPKLILVPLLAFDKYKNRIGYGKGYYEDKSVHKM